jgi:hypothetical protein
MSRTTLCSLANDAIGEIATYHSNPANPYRQVRGLKMSAVKHLGRRRVVVLPLFSSGR